jgi:pimeloyl-ACP methyl ester carboxylesterase
MARVHANGIDIEYESFGRESDPALLLIMGFGAQLILWPRAFCEGLAAKGFRVIRFDNRDAGKSTRLTNKGVPDVPRLLAQMAAGEPVAAPYLLSDMAADAVGLLDALGVERAHIVGASMGGMIAQLVAAEHPRRTKSLVSIMSTTGRRDLPQPKPEAMVALTQPPASTAREDRIAAETRLWTILASPGYPWADGELRALTEEQVDRIAYDPAGSARQMAAIFASPPRNDVLKNVHCPALVIHGADDPLVLVEGGKDTAASIPGCELAIIPGMAHSMPNALVPLLLKRVGDFVAGAEAKARNA